MLNHRRKIAELLSSGTWLRSQTGRILPGLVLAINAPQVADAARGGEGRAAKRNRDNDDARNNQDTREETKKSESESEHQNDGKVSAETSDSRAKSDKAGKRDQDESTDENDDTREQRAADAGKTRGETRRNTDSDSDSSKTSAEDQDSHHHAGRRFREFEQQGNDAPAADEPDVTTVTPANPNVIINDVP
ncbi:MAG: hypothetical protein K0S14_2455, partial [Thermomicrobiales bacterium]|nr:hypothetical protein [Thermomicrobiales bacterium]